MWRSWPTASRTPLPKQPRSAPASAFSLSHNTDETRFPLLTAPASSTGGGSKRSMTRKVTSPLSASIHCGLATALVSWPSFRALVGPPRCAGVEGPGSTNSRFAIPCDPRPPGALPVTGAALSPQVDYWPHEVRKGQDPQSRARRTEEHELCTSALAVPPGDK